jgi:hypothetical protein
VNGSGFLNGSSVRWNGSSLSTAYVSGNQLTASVAAPLIAGAGSAAVTVVNPNSATSNSLSFTVNPAGSEGLLIITASPLPAGGVGAPYSQALAATGGTTPYRAWTLVSGNLPPGISLSTLGGVLTGFLTGVPTASGGYTFTVQVADALDTTATKEFTLTINLGAVSTSEAGIVNAASYEGGAIEPGEILTIVGLGLGPNILVGLELDSRRICFNVPCWNAGFV